MHSRLDSPADLPAGRTGGLVSVSAGGRPGVEPGARVATSAQGPGGPAARPGGRAPGARAGAVEKFLRAGGNPSGRGGN
ncbi:hypothetical protein GCM10025734_62840 [Kitasatospora paranensis]